MRTNISLVSTWSILCVIILTSSGLPTKQPIETTSTFNDTNVTTSHRALDEAAPQTGSKDLVSDSEKLVLSNNTAIIQEITNGSFAPNDWMKVSASSEEGGNRKVTKATISPTDTDMEKSTWLNTNKANIGETKIHFATTAALYFKEVSTAFAGTPTPDTGDGTETETTPGELVSETATIKMTSESNLSEEKASSESVSEDPLSLGDNDHIEMTTTEGLGESDSEIVTQIPEKVSTTTLQSFWTETGTRRAGSTNETDGTSASRNSEADSTTSTSTQSEKSTVPIVNGTDMPQTTDKGTTGESYGTYTDDSAPKTAAPETTSIFNTQSINSTGEADKETEKNKITHTSPLPTQDLDNNITNLPTLPANVTDLLTQQTMQSSTEKTTATATESSINLKSENVTNIRTGKETTIASERSTTTSSESAITSPTSDTHTQDSTYLLPNATTISIEENSQQTSTLPVDDEDKHTENTTATTPVVINQQESTAQVTTTRKSNETETDISTENTTTNYFTAQYNGSQDDVMETTPSGAETNVTSTQSTESLVNVTQMTSAKPVANVTVTTAIEDLTNVTEDHTNVKATPTTERDTKVTNTPTLEVVTNTTHTLTTKKSANVTDAPFTESVKNVTDIPMAGTNVTIAPTTITVANVTDSPTTKAPANITSEPLTETGTNVTDTPTTKIVANVTEAPKTETVTNITDTPPTTSIANVTDPAEPEIVSNFTNTLETTTTTTMNVTVTDNPTAETMSNVTVTQLIETERNVTEPTIDTTQMPENTTKITENATSATDQMTNETYTETTTQTTTEPFPTEMTTGPPVTMTTGMSTEWTSMSTGWWMYTTTAPIVLESQIRRITADRKMARLFYTPTPGKIVLHALGRPLVLMLEEDQLCGVQSTYDYGSTITRAKISLSDFSESYACGMCLLVKQESVILRSGDLVQVDGVCNECEKGEISYASASLMRTPDKNITFQAVACPVGPSTVIYHFYKVMREHMSVQAINTRYPITRMQFRRNETSEWEKMLHTIDGYFVYQGDSPRRPFYLRTIAYNGMFIEDKFVMASSEQMFRSGQQIPIAEDHLSLIDDQSPDNWPQPADGTNVDIPLGETILIQQEIDRPELPFDDNMFQIRPGPGSGQIGQATVPVSDPGWWHDMIESPDGLPSTWLRGGPPRRVVNETTESPMENRDGQTVVDIFYGDYWEGGNKTNSSNINSESISNCAYSYSLINFGLLVCLVLGYRG